MEIISFNSYKGGTCRTTTCYNSLPYLTKTLKATGNNPIIVFDVDLESIGLTHLLHSKMSPTEIKALKYHTQNLFKDTDHPDFDSEAFFRLILDEKRTYLNEKFFESFERVGKRLGLDDNASVLFLSAARDPDFKYDLTINSNDLLVSKLIEFFIDVAENFPEYAPAALLFDCASGTQLSTMITLGYAKKIVVCTRMSYQSREGTQYYLTNEISRMFRVKDDAREVFLLPTAVPENPFGTDAASADILDLRDDAYDGIIRNLIGAVNSRNRERALKYSFNTSLATEESMGIPELERFKWSESLLYSLDRLTEKERVAQTRYERLAQLIAGGK